jgi:hypothetical protein
MRIGELAGLAGVSTRTVRHYHRIGLLPARTRRLVELGLSLDAVADAHSDDRGRALVEVIREIDTSSALCLQQPRLNCGCV